MHIFLIPCPQGEDRRTDEVLLGPFCLSSACKNPKEKKCVALAVGKLYGFLMYSRETGKHQMHFTQTTKHQTFTYMNMDRTETINPRNTELNLINQKVVNIYILQEFPFVFYIEFKMQGLITDLYASATNPSFLSQCIEMLTSRRSSLWVHCPSTDSLKYIEPD